MSGQNFRQGDVQFFRGNQATDNCVVNKDTTNSSGLTTKKGKVQGEGISSLVRGV